MKRYRVYLYNSPCGAKTAKTQAAPPPFPPASQNLFQRGFIYLYSI